MAESDVDTVQFEIQVQEGGFDNNGEDVIVIYNYDGDLTEEVLAKTIAELSRQPDQLGQVQGETSTGLNQVVKVEEPFVLMSQDQGQASVLHLLQERGIEALEIKEEVLDTNDQATLHAPVPGTCAGVNEANQPDAETKQEFELRTEVGSLESSSSKLETLSSRVESLFDDSFHQFLERDFKDKVTTEWEKNLSKFENASAKGSNSISALEEDLPGKKDVIKISLNQLLSDHDEEEEAVERSCSYDKCNFQCSSLIKLQRHLKTEHFEEDPFACAHCSKKFKLEISLQLHKMSHGNGMKSEKERLSAFIGNVPKPSYTCPLCDFSYHLKRELSTHNAREHNRTPLIFCKKCYFACLNDEELEKHMSSQAHDFRMLCTLCGARCKSIYQHIKQVHSDDRPYLCSECGYKSKTLGTLNIHKQTHSAVKAFTCTKCDYKCHTKDYLKRHMVKHETVNNFPCPLCKYATKASYRLKKHMQIHNAKKRIFCPKCDFSCHDRLQLRNHKEYKHKRIVNIHCKECKLTFDRVAQLKIHAHAVHKSRHFHFCRYCAFSCDLRSELRKHMETHFGKHMYACELCDYTCDRTTSLKRHMWRHKKVKNFFCKLCDYACAEKGDLEKHQAKHSDDKPFACPHCQYRCKLKPRLEKHIAVVHSGIRPFFCPHCEYTAKSEQNLKKHLFMHTAKKPFACVLCSYAAAEKAKLKRHMKTHMRKIETFEVIEET